MLTARGWWCLFYIVLLLLVGVALQVSGLVVAGMGLLVWFAWEWLFFVIRARTLPGQLRLRREMRDERGPVTTLWAGRQFTVRLRIEVEGVGRLPYAAVADPVPFGTLYEEGLTTVNGPLGQGQPLELEYTVACPLPGQARFEGARVEITDLQGFFAHLVFVRTPAAYTILPAALARRGGGPLVKHRNELPPPGIHRLHQPGSGSELLDLREYLPGDPPRTIAWKVSARRDRLITKEFESEVPVRCTLFLDTSSSVRVPSPSSLLPDDGQHAPGAAYFKPLDRLVEMVAALVRAAAATRDMVGLCLFDEQQSRVARPERTARHQARVLALLGEAAALAPFASRADPQALEEVAYSLAAEVYPDLMHPGVNRMPTWLTWLVAFPRFTRHPRGLLGGLNRVKRSVLLWGTFLLPLALVVGNVVAVATGWVPDWAGSYLGAVLFYGTPLCSLCAWLVFAFSLLTSGPQRRQARMRKRLAALFGVLYGPLPGALQAILEDDDLYALYLQRFLGEHQVPCALPLYDEQGRYLFVCPEKVGLLAKALVESTGRGRDNELFVLMADLLELDGHLGPLLQAVKVALGRHHRVVLVCPWPQGVPLPTEGRSAEQVEREGVKLDGLLRGLAEARTLLAYQRIRREFSRLGVQVLCAGSDESVPLILKRIEQLRSVGGRR